MGKPSNTIGDRDSGKRLYVGKRSYQERIRRQTIASYDRVWKSKHSESKKPYLPDQSYPLMEYKFDPWEPTWPPHEVPPWGPITPDDPPVDGWPEPPPYERPPAWPPDVPFDPDDPTTRGGHPGKQPNPWPYLGCDFIDRFRPNPVAPGELAFVTMALAPDDTIQSVETVGPVELLTNRSYLVGLTGQKNQERWGSKLIHIVVRAWSAEQIGNDPRYRNIAGGTVYFHVEIKTTSYGMSNEPGKAWSIGVCSGSGFVENCPPEISISWDSDLSAETIGRNDSAQIAVLNGAPPYHWFVSGTGFDIPDAKTSSHFNTITTDGTACGSGVVTVVDACGEETAGAVRCTTGGWVDEDDPCECTEEGVSNGYSLPPPGWGMFTRTVMDKKCFEAWESSYGGSGSCPDGCITNGCAGRCNSYTYCRTDCGCGSPCITNSTSLPAGSTVCTNSCWEPSPGSILCVCRSTGSKCQKWAC